LLQFDDARFGCAVRAADQHADVLDRLIEREFQLCLRPGQRFEIALRCDGPGREPRV
jgi:hypothetical protein